MIRIAAVILALLTPNLAFAQIPSTDVIEVMVLGAPHLNNPGRDVHNVRIDPVTTPEMQAQLQRIAEDLSRFRPTALALEKVAADQTTMEDRDFAAFDPATLTTDANERVQIGYRLARMADVTRVYAVDEKDAEGKPSYFPYGEVVGWAQSHDRGDQLAAMGTEVKGFLSQLEERQRTETLGALLAEVNRPGNPLSTGNGLYYNRFNQFGGGGQWPGAELNGRWYTRNAIIWAKLMSIARPGDRIVLMFGAGHSYWLRHFASSTPGFRLVEPNDYLTED